MRRIDAKRIQALIKLMLENEEQERYGYDLLLQETMFGVYFDELSKANLFDRSRVQLDKTLDSSDSYYANKPWVPVEFLLRCATSDDPVTVKKTLQVVTNVGNGDPPLQNYLVQSAFTEILSAVPLSEVLHQHITLIIRWLSSETYTWPTVHALVTGLLPKLITSRESDHAKWACDLIDALTVFRSETATEGKFGRIGFLQDESLVGDFLEKNVPTLAGRAGDLLLPLLLRRCREYFSFDGGQEGSFWKRPAIEDHEQNRDYEATPKALVDATRAAMLVWVDADFASASSHLLQWLNDPAEIVRRLAIHLLNERFSLLRSLVLFDRQFIKNTLLAHGHLHETYRLLRNRFDEFTLDEQAATIKAIDSISLSKGAEVPGLLEAEKLRWLSSIAGGTNVAADRLRASLNATSVAGLTEHPDFYFYMSSGWSGSKSPLTIPEVAACCASNQLVLYANAFGPDGDDWGGPSVRGLCNAIETAIVESPALFADRIEELRAFDPPYQYAVFRGFANLLDKSRNALDWELVWPRLLASMEALLSRDSFWLAVRQNGRLSDPDAAWVPPVLAELLRKAASPDDILAVDVHMGRSLSVIETLLTHCERLDEPGTDVVTRVINTSFGKALEALFSCALRIRRCDERYPTEVGHGLLERIRHKFDFEAVRTGQQSVEFSTLSGNYVNHLRFIDEQWLATNFDKLFPLTDPVRLQCAIAGLAYAQASEITYQQLEKSGAIDVALKLELIGRNARQQLLRQVGLAYLWKIESLSSQKFQTLLQPAHIQDLRSVVQIIRSAPPAAEHDSIAGVTAFWEFCVDACKPPAPEDYRKEILAMTAGLAKHVPAGQLSDTHKDLIRKVAPYAWYPHEEIFFVPELLRLLQNNEEWIGLCMLEFLRGMRKSLGDNRPFHDFEGRYMQFAKQLCQSNRSLATDIVDQLLHLKEFKTFLWENLS